MVTTIAALILGIMGGVTGLAIALGIDIPVPGTPLVLPSVSTLARFDIVTHITAPLASILGAIITLRKRVIGGVLMLVGAAGMVLTFEFDSFTAIPIVSSALGAVLAVYAGDNVASARASGR